MMYLMVRFFSSGRNTQSRECMHALRRHASFFNYARS
jgi:hypothetical protein